MTTQEVHKELELLLDQSQEEYYTSAKRDSLLNQALDEWIEDRYKPFELNQRVRDELGNLVVEFNAPSGREIPMSLLSKYKHILSLFGKYRFICGTSQQERWVEIVPLKVDRLSVINDPHNQPTDAFPNYIENSDLSGVRTIRVLSRNAPSVIWGEYIRKPESFNYLLPNFQWDSILPLLSSQYEVINRAVRIASGIQENQFRYQAQVSQEIPSKV